MELNLREADIAAIFDKGLQAQIAGDLSAAEQLYQETLVIKPEHPEANHNIGVVLVAKNELNKALEFFKFALDHSPNVSIFWASYIDTLIKLERIGESKTLIKAVKQAGISCDKIEAISLKLNILYQEPGAKVSEECDELIEQQKFEDAIKICMSLTETYPSSAILNINLGKCYFEIGQIEQAISSYKKATEYQPQWELGFALLGQIYSSQGNVDAAIEGYKKALLLNPDYAECYVHLGIALQQRGKPKEAIEAYTKALSLRPDDAHAYNNLGVALKDQGKLEEATEAYNKALLLKSNYANAYNNLGVSLKDRGQLEEAIEAFNNVLSIKPDYAEAFYNMGNALQEKDKLEEAIQAYNKALAIKPDFVEVHYNMGIALRLRGKPKEAIEAYTKALSLKPNCAEAYNHMGVILKDQGKIEEAVEAFNNVLSIKPDYAEAHRNLSPLVKYEPNNPQIITVTKLMERPNLKDQDICHLHYTIAKMKEDLGDLDAAFENYVAGGALRQKLLAYDQKHDQRLFTNIKSTAPKLKEFSLRVSHKATSQIPIFILGMPRSGTTLVEQIVSSHSQVCGAGELSFLDRFGGKLCLGDEVISSKNLLEVRKAYLNELKKVSENKPFVTDKMPHNFINIGVIVKALPEAKIIHVKRDPAATIWSNFKHYFHAKGLGYSYKLEDTVAFYKLYQNLVEFWDESYGDKIYHIDYDKLTVKQEPETKRLLEYLELDWEDACLSPQDNQRSVRTASQLQVREKVYKGSSKAWRKFEPYLKDVLMDL